MTYTQAKECIQELGREGLEKLINQYGGDVIKAAFACDIPVEHIEEAYQGHWNSDADFARETEEDIGNIGLKYADTVEIAIEESLKKHGKDARILILPNGPLILPFLT